MSGGLVVAFVLAGVSLSTLTAAPSPGRLHLLEQGPTASRRGPWPVWGVVVLAAVSSVVVPPAGPAVLVWWWARPKLAARRAAAGEQRQIEESLPDVVELLALCRSAGWSVPLAVPLVAAQATGPVPDALGRAANRAAQGQSLADALVDVLAPLGDQAARLAHVLADHLRYGTPLAAGLDRLALEVRLHRRRLAERRARRVPVRLLLPLVSCTLPAFALLTVVPLLVGSLRSLSR